jgi:hypothetical protein
MAPVAVIETLPVTPRPLTGAKVTVSGTLPPPGTGNVELWRVKGGVGAVVRVTVALPDPEFVTLNV